MQQYRPALWRTGRGCRDANTYSSGDLFAAGIVDNGIGPLVCIGDATGGGGANVWPAEVLADALRPANLTLPKFPKGVDFTMAIRRAVRSGASDGALIEDGGVAGQHYDMTGTDVLHDNKDLIEHCARILAAQPWTQDECEAHQIRHRSRNRRSRSA